MWPSGQIYEEAIFTTQADGVLRYMRQAECSRIYAERNHVGKLAGATAQYMWPSGQIYEEAVFTTQADGVLRYMRQAERIRIYAERNHVGKLAGATAQYMWRVSDEYTKKPFSQLKLAELHGICGRRNASEYTQSEIMLANWQALLRSICGAQATNIRRSHFHNSSGRSFTVYAASGVPPNI